MVAHPEDPSDRFFIFRSWKNLGSDKSFKDPFWRAHVQKLDSRSPTSRVYAPLSPFLLERGIVDLGDGTMPLRELLQETHLSLYARIAR